MRSFSWPCALVLGVLLLGSTGCGGSAVELVPVEGQVTFGGGPWPKPGNVMLLPSEAPEGQPLIPAFGSFGVDGRFKAECNNGTGLLPGRYTVSIECWELAPDDSRKEYPLGKSYVPDRYRDAATSGLEFHIQPGEPGPYKVGFNIPKE
jgi:hypothetical protein